LPSNGIIEVRFSLRENQLQNLGMRKTLRENFPLSDLTTYKIGGIARYYCEPDTIGDLVEVLSQAKRENLKWFVLGSGSNVLIADEGFPGIVIRLGDSFKNIVINEREKLVTAGAGTKLPRLGLILAKGGWDGFIYMCVIPGTVGGAVCINAGTTNEGEIKDRFVSAEIVNNDGIVKSISAHEMNFSYRSSSLLRSRNIVLSATFRLESQVSVDSLKKEIAKVARKRKSVQPTVPRNCGSVFKKPSRGRSAGWYIEQAGLKGYRIGDAQVSPEHANWIVNHGNATASDVKSLIELIRARVQHHFGVELETEVIYVS